MNLSYENVFFGMLGEFTTRLAAAITEVNAENTDFAIQQIPTPAVFIGSLNESAANYPQFVLSYIESVSSETQGNAVARTIIVEFDLAIAKRSDNLDYKRLLRYWEALTRAAQDLFSETLVGYTKPEVDILSPISVTLFDGSEELSVIGVKVSATIFN